MKYDADLLRLREEIARKQQLEAKLNDLREQRRIFDSKIVKLRVAHRMEQEDVDKLESKSLSTFLYQLFGKLDDKLSTERAEAVAAKAKLEAATQELNAVEEEIQQIMSQLSPLFDIETAYAKAMDQKRSQLKTSGSPAGAEILELEEKIAFCENQKKEIREAISVGRSALCTADDVLSELRDADNWNTWDLIGGDGIITQVAKHGHLDSAQNHILTLQNQLRRFRTELSDINIQANLQVNVDGFLRFADYFFDGIFADWTVGNRIQESQNSVYSVKRKIEQAMKNLTGMEQSTDSSLSAWKARIDELILEE